MSYRLGGAGFWSSSSFLRSPQSAAPLPPLRAIPASVIGSVTAETGIGLMGRTSPFPELSSAPPPMIAESSRFVGVPAGTIEVRARRLGFRPDAVTLTVPQSGTESVNIKLEVATQALQPVTVRGRSVKYTGRWPGTTTDSSGAPVGFS